MHALRLPIMIDALWRRKGGLCYWNGLGGQSLKLDRNTTVLHIVAGAGISLSFVDPSENLVVAVFTNAASMESEETLFMRHQILHASYERNSA